MAKKITVAVLGFLIGLFFFFPWSDIKDLITTKVARATGIMVQMQTFSPTTGLVLGPARGSLLAFSGTKAVIHIPPNKSVSCDEIIVGPRFWPLLLGQLQLSVGCLEANGGKVVALVTVNPFWSPSKMSLDGELTQFSLENADLGTNAQGIFSGTLAIKDAPLSGSGIPEISWKLTGSQVRTPDANLMVMQLPSLDLSDIKTEGSFSSHLIKIPVLNFGNKQSPLEGKINFQSDFSPNTGPENGSISGTLRVNPEVEATTFKNINLTILFGAPNEQGVRAFSRPFNGGIMSLMMTKYDAHSP